LQLGGMRLGGRTKPFCAPMPCGATLPYQSFRFHEVFSHVLLLRPGSDRRLCQDSSSHRQGYWRSPSYGTSHRTGTHCFRRVHHRTVAHQRDDCHVCWRCRVGGQPRVARPTGRTARHHHPFIRGSHTFLPFKSQQPHALATSCACLPLCIIPCCDATKQGAVHARTSALTCEVGPTLLARWLYCTGGIVDVRTGCC
jgi:hypothetical protein